MVRKDTIVIGLITVFIVTPAVLALTAYFITKNPSLRPLGITVDRLSEAGQLENNGLIIAVVDIGSESRKASSKTQYEAAIEKAFNQLNAEVRVKFRTIPGSNVNVTYLVGESRIGPFPASRASEGILPAIEAEKMVVAHRKATVKEQERRATVRRDGFWDWVFD
ncbi:hypothetical protein [Celeribacter neptunius]|uniref:Uncharacterized protein n=1 Tax=Celeribacter neptunius TaxID=588602 RepID=A0A1I3SA36_9RHOB|nr:hypothetical protein [Celeribacter neptunius]SFJ55250.1 hypothetical protein SAMN04487991_2380 [Celeribacter neptunius]